MTDLAQYPFGVGGTYLTFNGSITSDGSWVHLVATLDWTAFLPWAFQGDPIWLAIPRDDFDAADNPENLGILPGVGTFMFSYAGPDDPFGFPAPYYQGTWVTNGDDEFGGQLIRGDCYLFLNVPDEGAVGLAMHSEIDLRWPAGPGLGFEGDIGGRGNAGQVEIGNGPEGVVPSSARRPVGYAG